MTDQKLEARLARAVTQAAPNDLEEILSRCDERSGSQEGKVIPMTKTKTARPVRWRALIAACLALALIGGTGIFYQQANAVTSVISIDVNPSIELRVNRDEKVLSCTPLNEDAHTALAEMNDGKDLEGAKLTVAVNAVVGALVRHGYLDGLSSAILVSVEDRDQARAERMEEELRASISDLLAAEAPNTTVLSQTLPQDAGYNFYNSYNSYNSHHDDDHESDHHISSGKAALVNKVMQMNGTIALNSTTAYDKLCALSVEELNDLLELGEMRIPIGKSEAVIAAGVYAGTAVLSSVIPYVEAELDKGIYEVKLLTGWGEFEYAVDAFTGEILSGQADLLALATRPNDPPSQQTTPDPQVTPAPVTTPVPQNTPVPPEALALLGKEDAWAAVCRDLDCVRDDLDYTACELDYEDGHPHCYELEFCWNGNQYEYEVDCYTGAVLKHEWETCDEVHHDHHGTAPASSTAALIDEAAAWNAVCRHVGCNLGDISYSSCELDRDGHCYELEFCWNDCQYEYEIDCYSGAVLGHEWEYCKEEGHSHRTSQSSHHGREYHD